MQESGPKLRAKQALSSKVTEAFAILLETKFLYQNVHVDTSTCSHPGLSKTGFKNVVGWFEKIPFMLREKTDSLKEYPSFIELPAVIHTSCSFCKRTNAPHVSFSQLVVSVDEQLVGKRPEATSNDQTFVIPYRCQSCQTGSLVFLVRRMGLKLQLVGRSQIPFVSLPSFYPKEYEEYFKKAIIARISNNALSSVCLLRVALEQFMRRETHINDRCSGNELWSRLKKSLDSYFPLDIAPSLGAVYDNLSSLMHFPPDDTEPLENAFDQAWKDIENFLREFDSVKRLSGRKRERK